MPRKQTSPTASTGKPKPPAKTASEILSAKEPLPNPLAPKRRKKKPRPGSSAKLKAGGRKGGGKTGLAGAVEQWKKVRKTRRKGLKRSLKGARKG